MFGQLFDRMKVILGKSESNKTMELLNAASKDTGACIVCANSVEAKSLKSIIKENDWSIEVITFNQFVEKKFTGTDIKSFYFSDVDKIFRGITYPKKIKMMTVNTDNISCI